MIGGQGAHYFTLPCKNCGEPVDRVLWNSQKPVCYQCKLQRMRDYHKSYKKDPKNGTLRS